MVHNLFPIFASNKSLLVFVFLIWISLHCAFWLEAFGPLKMGCKMKRQRSKMEHYIDFFATTIVWCQPQFWLNSFCLCAPWLKSNIIELNISHFVFVALNKSKLWGNFFFVVVGEIVKTDLCYFQQTFISCWI